MIFLLTKCLKKLLTDDNFDNILDNNPGFLAFKNGIMNLETKNFRPNILWSDFITQTIEYDYIESNFDFLKGKLKQILCVIMHTFTIYLLLLLIK